MDVHSQQLNCYWARQKECIGNSNNSNNNNNNSCGEQQQQKTNKQNKYQELANEICAMWKQKAAQVIPRVISSTGVIPKSLPQSLTRLNLNTYIHTTAKICNSWHMFNCKKLLHYK